MPGMVSALEIQKEVELNMIYLRSLHMHFFLSSASSSPSLPLPPPILHLLFHRGTQAAGNPPLTTASV